MQKFVIFETGSGKWIDESCKSGFTSDKSKATRYVSSFYATRYLMNDDRYGYLVKKLQNKTLDFQVIL